MRTREGKGVLVPAEERDQHGRSRPAGGSVRRGIIRYGWREQQWLPAEIGHREIIAVRARAPDGSEWPPEVVEILRVKGGDVGVGQGHFQSGKRGVRAQRDCGTAGRRASGATRLQPFGELSYQKIARLVWSAVRAVLLSEPKALISLKSKVYSRSRTV